MGTQATLLQALQALYHDPNPLTRNAANQWLEEFQHNIEAWQVTDNLLHDSNSNLEVLYFCAQTLRTKVQRDFDDLPSSAIMSLRDSLVALLKKFRHGPPAVRTQLSLGLAALAMHVPPEHWGDIGIVKWLEVKLCSESDIAASLLEILTVLPQEAYSYKIAVRPERRRQFQKELASSVQHVYMLLIAQSGPNSLEHIEQIIRAFASWIHLSYGMQASMLASHPLVAAAFSGLGFDKSFDAAVDAVTELIRFTVNGSPGGLAEQMPLVQVIVPHVMALRPRFLASLKLSIAEKEKRKKGETVSLELDGDEEDEEVMKGIAHLFAEMGESYAELIANGSEEAMMVVQALAEVTSHPEDTISEMTYNFWFRFSNVLTSREYYKGCETEAAVELERERRLGIFRPTFEVLVGLVSYRVKYPEGFESWRKDERADFKQIRYSVTEVLMDVAAVLGGDVTVRLLSESLFQMAASAVDNTTWDWRPVEASLYCIRGIARAVPKDEATVMPRVMMLLPQLPPQHQLLYTAFLTIGAFADWLGVAQSAPSLLPSLLQLLTRGLAIPEDPAAAAALAFRHVCDACRNALGSSIDVLLGFYAEAMSSNKKFQLLPEDELQIVEGLSMVVSALPPNQTPQALEALCQPMVTSLMQLVTGAQQTGSVLRLPLSQYITPLDRLANIFRYVKQQEPLANAFRKLWPTLKIIFIQKGADMRTMERLCRLCKYAVANCGKLLGDIIAPLLEEVQQRFQEHQHSCFLYLASEVIKVFAGEQSCSAYLGNMTTVLLTRAIDTLKSIEEFTSHPDVADDCFLLASRCIRYCPQLLVNSAIFSPLVDCATIGITIQHREACRSILSFIQDIFQLRKSHNGKEYSATIDGVLLPRGSTLCRILIGGLVGALPESRLEEVTDALLSLAKSYGPQATQWAHDAVRLIPSTVATDGDRMTFLQAISSAATRDEASNSTSSMEELSDVCRRNKKVRDLVQNALQPQKLNLSAVG